MAAPTEKLAWDGQSAKFLGKLADAIDASNDDCDKLVAGLKALKPDAAETATVLVEGNHELHDYPQDAMLTARFRAHPGLFDKCEAAATPGFDDAVDSTLFVVEPIRAGRELSAFRDVYVPKP